MFTKELMEKILDEITIEYSKLELNDLEGEIVYTQDNIDEPILSSSFVSKCLKYDLNSTFIGYSEFIILNKFQNIWDRNSKLSKEELKILINNNKWEIDSIFYDKNTKMNQIFEFKYGKYTLTDLLRSITILCKLKNVEAIFIVFYENKKLLANSKPSLNYININIGNWIFQPILDYMNHNEEQPFQSSGIKKSIDNLIFENKLDNNWTCLKIYKSDNSLMSYENIYKKENFKKIESFVNYCYHKFRSKNNNLKIDFNSIQLLLSNVEPIFLNKKFETIYFNENDNSDEKNSKNGNYTKKDWSSIFRQNVLPNFFIKKEKNFKKIVDMIEIDSIRWIIDFVENKHFVNEKLKVDKNILLSIENDIKNENIENIYQNILHIHRRWSKLFNLNKEIKEKNNKNPLNDDKTTKIDVKNKVTDVIKQVIFDMSEKYTSLKPINLFNKKIETKKITKNNENLNELSLSAIYVLYFYSKLHLYLFDIAKILDLDKEELLEWNYYFCPLKELSIINKNHPFNLSTKNIIDYPYYLNFTFSSKNNMNIFEQIFQDDIKYLKK